MRNPNYQKFIQALDKKRIKLDEPLIRHTSFKIGGPADLFTSVDKVEEMIAVLEAARRSKIKFFILGGGTNLLVADNGYQGLVIKNKINGLKLLGWGGKVQSPAPTTSSNPSQWRADVKNVHLQVGSGVATHRLVKFCLDESYAGLEIFYGLPGTVGGAIFGNSHYDDQLFNDRVSQIMVLDGQIKLKRISIAEFAKKKKIGENLVITSALFKLEKSDKNLVCQKAQSSLNKRKATQPLGLPSAGCIFQNISRSEAMRVPTPNFTQSAGFLIAACGLKGKQVGKVKISEKHANFFVNLGGAKAADVLKLIRIVKKAVLAKFNINLKREIIKVGF